MQYVASTINHDEPANRPRNRIRRQTTETTAQMTRMMTGGRAWRGRGRKRMKIAEGVVRVKDVIREEG